MCADEIPHDHAASVRARRTTVLYYRRPEVTITSRYLYVAGVRYDVRELSNLMRATGARHPGATLGTVILISGVALIVPFVSLIRSPLACLAAVASLIPGMAVLTCAGRSRPRMELLGYYRGQRVTLFATRDEREFGQVARALGRAVEAAALRRATVRAAEAALACGGDRQLH